MGNESKQVCRQRLTRPYIWLVITFGAVACLLAVSHLPAAHLDLRFLVLVLLTVAISSRISVKIPRVNATITVADTFIFLTILLYGWEAAVLIAAAEGTCSGLRLSKRPRTILFNASAMACSIFLTTRALSLIFGSNLELRHQAYSAVILVICVMALIHYMAHTSLAAVYLAYKDNQPMWPTWRKHYLWSSCTYFAGACLAGITVRFNDTTGFYTLIVTIPIVSIIYFTYDRYLEDIKATAAQAERAERERAEAERERAEQAERHLRELRESEERYRDLFENTTDLIQSVGPDGRLLYVNRAWRETLRYQEEEISGLSVFDIIHPESRAPYMAEFKRVKSGAAVDKVEAVFITKDGTPVTVEGSTSCKFIDGRPVSTQDIFRNITDRKRAEAERRRLEEQLLQAQKMESIGTLAGGVAHDFNNLLTVISGYSELLLEGPDQDDLQRPKIEEIKKAADRAGALTRQLLAFSRRQQLERKHIHLNDTIGDLMKMLRRLIGEDVEMRVHAAPNLPTVFADPGQMEQVLMNLAVNARDAMPGGGGLTIETHTVELDEAYCRHHPDVQPGKYVRIMISDTGTGMDAQTKQRIFEPFFTTKEVGKGTGLGLAVVYGIVQQHNGSIEVDSEVGQGTTFKIYLPVDGSAVEEEADTAPSSLQGGTETILLVEDEASLRQLAQEILEKLGYLVIPTRDGEEAVEMYVANREQIDLVMLDMVMPRMSGPDAYERMRALRTDLPVVFMTGYSAEEVHSKFVRRNKLKEKGVALLQKPYSVEAIGRKVRAVLDASPSKLAPLT